MVIDCWVLVLVCYLLIGVVVCWLGGWIVCLFGGWLLCVCVCACWLLLVLPGKQWFNVTLNVSFCGKSH